MIPEMVSSTSVLEDLLLDLFETEGLRIWISALPGGEQVLSQLPDEGTPPASLVHKLVRALKARGLVNKDFFAALVRARPNRASTIEIVAKQWLEDSKEDSRAFHRAERPAFSESTASLKSSQIAGPTINISGSTIAGHVAGRDVVVIEQQAKADELIEILEERGEKVLVALSQHQETLHLVDPFRKLHTGHLSSLRSGKFVLAHERSSEIFQLLAEAKNRLEPLGFPMYRYLRTDQSSEPRHERSHDTEYRENEERARQAARSLLGADSERTVHQLERSGGSGLLGMIGGLLKGVEKIGRKQAATKILIDYENVMSTDLSED